MNISSPQLCRLIQEQSFEAIKSSFRISIALVHSHLTTVEVRISGYPHCVPSYLKLSTYIFISIYRLFLLKNDQPTSFSSYSVSSISVLSKHDDSWVITICNPAFQSFSFIVLGTAWSYFVSYVDQQ